MNIFMVTFVLLFSSVCNIAKAQLYQGAVNNGQCFCPSGTVRVMAADCMCAPSSAGSGNAQQPVAQQPQAPASAVDEDALVNSVLMGGSSGSTAAGGLPHLPAGAGEISSDPPTSLSCDTAATMTKSSCMGQMIAGPAIAVIGSIASSSSGGGMAAQCKKAQDINRASVGVNLALMVTCQVSISKCEKQCDWEYQSYTQKFNIAKTNYLNCVRGSGASGCFAYEAPMKTAYSKAANARSKLPSCKTNEMQQMMTMMQVINGAGSLAKSEDCQRYAEMDKCTGQKAYSDPNCPIQYCANPAHSKEQACGGSGPDQCAGAMAQTTLCICKANPMAAGCPNNGANANNNNPWNNKQNELDKLKKQAGEGLNFEQGKGDGLPEFKEGAWKNADAAQQKGGGLEGSGGGGSGGVPGGEGGQQAGPGPYDTNVIGGLAGGAGGGGYGSGGGGYGGGGGAYGFAPKGGSKDGGGLGFDLKQFLPGGAKAAGRNPANISPEKAQAGITPSMGLSNFQKVTSQMGRQQSSLNP